MYTFMYLYCGWLENRTFLTHYPREELRFSNRAQYNVDETYKRALEAGAEPVQELVKKEDEDKRGGVKDTGGTTWWIATKVK